MVRTNKKNHNNINHENDYNISNENINTIIDIMMAVQETGMSLSTAIDALPVCLTMMITGSNFSKTASYFQKKY